MTFSVRHQGSPRSIEGLSAEQVLEGLQDGLWEPTDEVRGAQQSQWVALEDHPQFADAAAEIQPAPAPAPADETRLDMNPLIDVALVLLIFFILTTFYKEIRKSLDMPGAANTAQKGRLKEVSPEEVKELMIQVVARLQNGVPVIQVEGAVVPIAQLDPELRRLVRRTRKTHMLIDAAGVEWGVVVAIQDAARGAGVQNIHVLAESPAS